MGIQPDTDKNFEFFLSASVGHSRGESLLTLRKSNLGDTLMCVPFVAYLIHELKAPKL